MSTILDTIADYARVRVAKDKESISLDTMRFMAQENPVKREPFIFENALKKDDLAFICEVKKASPSKGIIDEVFNYKEIAKAYEEANAECMSCLTEPKWFLGSDKIFTDIRKTVNTPMIRKDFTVDEYQIYQAKCMGADAVLLICSLLDTDTIKRYIGICNSLGLSALVETHDAEEIKSAVNAGARMIGVNNRNLKDFSVDFTNAARLRNMIPEGTLYVAESGVKSAEDVETLRKIGADAVLMGEVLMRAENKSEMLASFRRAPM